MSRIVLSSKLLDVDVESEFLAELGELMSDTEFPVDKAWHAKIEMRPHPQAKTNVMYSMSYAPKKRVIKIAEKFKGQKYEHPVDLPEDMVDAIPLGFVIDFIEGLPSATEYV